MRISDAYIGSRFIHNLNRSRINIEQLRTKIALNTKITKPSDEPIGAARVLNLSKQLEGVETYMKNSEGGIAYLEETIFHMESMQSEIERVMVKLTELNNGTIDDGLPAIGDQIDALIDSMLDLANAEFDGKYLFAGTDHADKPYGYTADGSAIELKVTDVSQAQVIQISKHATQKINMTGEEIFGAIDGTDIFNNLIAIRESLYSGEVPSDALMESVSDFNESLINNLSTAGNIINRLHDNKDLLDNQTLLIKDLISREKDIDVAEAIMELQTQEYLLDLSYRLSSTLLPKSLVDFL
jgi:flagellar hook-associated protein 3 FlgL